MQPKKWLLYGFTLSILVVMSGSNPCWATLGGGSDSVELDRKALEANVPKVNARKARSGKAESYTVQHMELPGLKIREYLSLEGLVFGVAWEGERQPNLEVLLGSYLPEYKDALSSHSDRFGRRRGVSEKSLETKNLHVDLSGYFRRIHGRAYLTSALPAGVTPNDIK